MNTVAHHMPVVEGGQVVGMLAPQDLIKALVLRPESTEPDAELLRRVYSARGLFTRCR